MKLFLRNLFIFLLITLCSNYVIAQNYFQQQVNYKIDVKLNDSLHTLHAFETIEYTNHSRDALDIIYFHLWPNAYQKNSALDKQLLSNGDSKLHFAKEKNKGFIDSLNFTSNAQKLRWEYDATNKDICIIYLPQPLLPNQTIEISTPFYVKIPSAKISRMGHIGQFYAITQWYPKLAVYDADGWHPIPYLNQGEFYSEFGNFDVSITLPENYVVGATGDLQTQSEIDFLNEKSNDTTKKKASPLDKVSNAFPSSSKKYKTIRYIQENVHDFAWFADKRFIVKKSEVKLPNSGNIVTTWAMYTPQNALSWKNVTQYINDAIFYYSKWNGDYPYKNCTAIDGTISAGGGMEYPTITIINPTTDSLQMDIVIAHEVGHNWFYGILGSNERLHPWMDEGINSFNEMRYVKTKYPNLNLPRMLVPSKISQNIIGLKKLPGTYFNYYSYWVAAIYKGDQSIALPAVDFTSNNYGQMVYQKTAASFNLLYHYLGEVMFDKCMHKYYETWKFKHPQPADIRAVFETTTGKNLSWFFDEVIGTDGKVILKKAHSKYDKSTGQFKLKLKNKGSVSTPTEITLVSKDSTYHAWLEPFRDDTTLRFEANIEKVILDKSYAGLNLLGSNIEFVQNEFFRPYFSRVKKRRVYFFPHATAPNTNNLFVVPVIGYNTASGLMPGVLLSNGFFPTKKIEWNISILNQSASYSFKYNWFPKFLFKRISLGTSYRGFQFSYPQNHKIVVEFRDEFSMHTSRFVRNLELIYKTNPNSKYSGGISISRIRINSLFNNYSKDLLYEVSSFNKLNTKLSSHSLSIYYQQFLNADYRFNNNQKFEAFGKIFAELKSSFLIGNAKKIRTRLFAGIFMNNHNRNMLSNAADKFGFSYWGNNDYTLSDTYVNRHYDSRQTYINDGGVRNRFDSYLTNTYNMLAFNTSVDILKGGLVSVYFDAAYSKTRYPFNEYSTYDYKFKYPSKYTNLTRGLINHNIFCIASGIRIALVPDYVEFYLPFYLYETIDGKRSFKDTWKNVNILINLTKLNPFDAARKAYD